MIPYSEFIEHLSRHCTSVAKCKQAHAFLLRTALLDDLHCASKLLSFLAVAPSGDLRYASRLFAHLRRPPDLFLWNTMIRGHARGPDLSAALSCFRLMLRAGLAPDHHTYPFVLAACARSRALEQGMRFHGETMKVGLDSDVYVLNALLQMYTRCGCFGAAHKLFDGNSHRDVVSWNVMMRGYLLAGFFEDALHLLQEMKEMDVNPDDVTLISLVSACSQSGDLNRGQWLHSYANERGLVKKSLNLGNAILDMYCKCGDLQSAQSIFMEMDEKDLLTWTTMISGLAKSGLYQEALGLFGRVQQFEKVKPDEVILVTMLSVCAHIGALDQGKYIHLLIDRYRVNRDVALETALVDMYAKCGAVDFALQVFEEMRERNVFTWNAVIGGLALHGHGPYSLQLFERMKNERIMPDDVTFIGLLSACSHAGLVDEGLELFRLMNDVYQIEPRMEHYGCVVDMLCRARLLQDALEFIERMPIRPNVVMWAALVGACRAVGDIKLAERLGKRVIELEPDTYDRYVMLSNIYAGSQRWDEALNVRNLMKAKGIEKAPGISWIELNGTVHEFVAGDKSHHRTEQIYVMVEEMCHRVRAAGYVSSTTEVLFNIEEEEKEHSLFLHSEKLAVAFGLISSVPGLPIRITKNLRVCSDCHSFLKAVSDVFSREIIARDRSRFHHFKGGICSCKDFW
ncbi:pentatricopeptide repeat-containing protein [Canna indica]|uniref:Pentatricopeptide repeat-containing protein n=1 Tax=Canna indica TaxID=4628 RepID=A0AAQ3JZ68_9LILI|nr:pentatricopeptide repeat-containing protein [Canna indica]